jgi:phage-related protein
MTTKFSSIRRDRPAFRVLFYRAEFGTEPARDWLRSQDRSVRLVLGQALKVLEMNGHELGMPHSKALGGRLFELRERIGKVRYRIFYSFHSDQIIVLLHGVAKSQRVIVGEIEIARNRLSDFLQRM